MSKQKQGSDGQWEQDGMEFAHLDDVQGFEVSNPEKQIETLAFLAGLGLEKTKSKGKGEGD